MKLKVISSRAVGLESGNVLLPAVVGRGVDAAVRFSDPWASRRHCVIDMSDGALVIRDLNSKHGTFVHGTPVDDAVLEPGDEITVGMTRILDANDSDANVHHLPELTVKTSAKRHDDSILASRA